MRQWLSGLGSRAIAFGIVLASFGLSFVSSSPTAAPWAS